MAALPLQHMAQHRNVRVDRIEQPEICYIRCRKVCEILVLLTAASGYLRALRSQYLEDSVHQPQQIIACANIEERRHKVGIELKRPALGPLDISNAQRGAPFASLVPRQQTQILPERSESASRPTRCCRREQPSSRQDNENRPHGSAQHRPVLPR